MNVGWLALPPAVCHASERKRAVIVEFFLHCLEGFVRLQGLRSIDLYFNFGGWLALFDLT